MKTFKYIMTSSLLLASVFTGCSDDDVDKGKTVITQPTIENNVFDVWLNTNYVQTYNIDYKYKYDHKEASYSYYLSPARLDKSMKLAKIIKHAWLEAYVEVAGIDFMRSNRPAILQVIGTAAWNENGTMTLGTAEGGLKITLYLGNWLDETNIDEMNRYFFKTMHHEFTHILQQSKDYPQEYNTISAANYLPSGWQNRTAAEAAALGFITPYAGSSDVEDITEITACYITNSDAQNATVKAQAGTDGWAIIEQKQQIMKSYMKEVWNIDMDQLRAVVHRRMGEVGNMTLIESAWQPLLTSSEAKDITRDALKIVKQELLKQLDKADMEVEKINARGQYHVCQVHNANLYNYVKE